jgi:hypothetical protein
LRSAGRTNCSKVIIADTGLPGSPKTSGPPSRTKRPAVAHEATEGQRVARLDLHSPEDEGAAELLEDAAHVVAIAHRHASGAHEHVGAEAGAKVALDLFRSVPGDAEVDRLGAELAALGREGVGVRGDDAPAVDRLVGLDELVAGGQDGDARPLVNGHDAAAQGGEQAYVGRTDDGPRVEHPVAHLHVLAGIADVVPELGGDEDPQAISLDLGVLLAHHRVRAGGNRGAGQDARRLAPPHRPIRATAGGNLEADRERAGPLAGRAGEIALPDGVAVHRGVVGGGELPRGDDRGGQDPAEGLAHGDGFTFQDGSRVEDGAQGFGRCESGPHGPRLP